MRRGCLLNLLLTALLLIVFGGSSYFWFTFFVKGRSLPTPNLIGKSLTEARATAGDLGVDLVVDEHRRNSDDVPVGHVVWQNRAAGATSFIKRGSVLRVELSAGPLVLRVPDLSGESSGTAVLRLGQQNMKVGQLAHVEADASGILAADPPTSTVVGPQAEISLLVGVTPAPPRFIMPDLIDRRLEDVRFALERRGLAMETIRFEAYPGIADGIIIRQYPLRGSPVSRRDAISVVVSRQEDTSIVQAP
jgi:eukaryotic-like serine/threonine-protein kinase